MAISTADEPDAPPGSGRRARWTDHWSTLRLSVRRVTEPAPTGLPRWPILLWFPALLVLLLAIATVLGISGSSTGTIWSVVGSGADPDLLAGVPRAIRSDEWLTQTSWIVSQARQGYPEVNPAVPGGLDATVLLGLPAWEWPTIFRPDAVGFLLFGLDHGLAVRWWLPGFAMMAACYAMTIGLVPRRPLTAAAVAASVFFWPLIQWWYLPSITWPTALCFLAIAATVFSLRDPRLWVRVLWAAATAYVAITAALTFYPPYLIPAVLVAAAIVAGLVLMESGARSADRLGAGRALVRLLPLVVGAAAAGAVLAVFLATRAGTIAAITGTVYPGQRLQATGAAGRADLVGTFSGIFSGGLDADEAYAGLLGPNASEASAPILLGGFLLIPLLYFAIRDWIADRRVQWVMLGCLACWVLLLAFLLVPGWDPIAHLLLLDRTTAVRSRLGLGLLSVVAIVLLVRRLDEGDARLPWWVTGATVAAAAGSVLLVHSALAADRDQALTGANQLRSLAVLFVVGVLLYTRGRAGPASMVLLLISLILTVPVNPLYRGIVDLSETALGQRVRQIDDAEPGTWLAVSGLPLSTVLVESGLPSFNGVQLYPVEQMWREIDPDGRFADQWNRYASMEWQPGAGEPVLRNTYPDVVVATFDSCSSFAQQHVTYVLADREVDQACLEQLGSGEQGPTRYWIYRVEGSGTG